MNIQFSMYFFPQNPNLHSNSKNAESGKPNYKWSCLQVMAHSAVRQLVD